MAVIDYRSVFDFLQEAREKIESGDPLPFSQVCGVNVVLWLHNKASLDQRESVKHFANNI